MIYITIQARTQSTRFPEKILQPLWNNKTVLETMIDRLSCIVNEKTQIIILTTTNPKDKKIIDLCNLKNIKYYAGDEHNVLNRMYEFSKLFLKENDAIIDLTSDCPVVCPNMIHKMLMTFWFNSYDYYSNVMTRTFPDGFDIQIYNYKILSKLQQLNIDYIEHTGWNIINYSGRLNDYYNFKYGNLCANKKQFNPQLGLTLDDPKDLIVLQNIFNYFNNDTFTCEDVMKLYLTNPKLFEYNKTIKRKIPGV